MYNAEPTMEGIYPINVQGVASLLVLHANYQAARVDVLDSGVVDVLNMLIWLIVNVSYWNEKLEARCVRRMYAKIVERVVQSVVQVDSVHVVWEYIKTNAVKSFTIIIIIIIIVIIITAYMVLYQKQQEK